MGESNTKAAINKIIVICVLAACLSVLGVTLLSGCITTDNNRANTLLLAVKTDGKWGYIDRSISYVIEPQFDDASYFYDDGYAIVTVDGVDGIIDSKGIYVVYPQFDSIAWY